MKINVDREVYGDGAISKCVYSLSDLMDCSRQRVGKFEEIVITPYSDTHDEREAEHLFWQRLNDYHLRDIIAHETSDIRTLLYAKAFAESNDFPLKP